ncbi:MurR/RpiR family transcriptional regulator [Sporosarcina sp. FSL W7-1349]|uniref:MurR/RpiR family transcriptional regulator n=1 Tax=Sporosarcina sp. FSL W7-1349 TaxID=2921561 RepID=UPI0030F623E5
MGEENVLSKIIKMKNNLPKKQKVFCEYVLENYRDLGLDSVAEIAKKAAVGTTTVLRTIQNLGYDSLGEFKKDIHKIAMESKIPKWWDFEESQQELSSEEMKIEKVWKEINLVQSVTLDKRLINSIQEAAKLIQQSDVTHVFGLRTARVAALYFENTINQFSYKVNQLSYEPHFIMDRLYHIKKGDLLVFIALSPFTQLTYQAVKYCAELGHPIVLITDDMNNSLIPLANVTLYTIRKEGHFTLVPTISLIETITVVLGWHLAEDSMLSLEEIGKLLIEKGIMTT